LQAEFTKAADEADVLSFLNVKVLAVLRSMREEQAARKQAEAKCGALAADGQLSDNNAEDEHGFDLRQDP